MMILSFRLHKRRILALALAVGVIGLGGFWLHGKLTSSKTDPIAEETAARKVNNTVKTPEQRLEFIQSFGWEVEPEPVEMMEVVIPAEFDEVYEKYNYLQKQQGYDLGKFKAKRCRRYSYVITNYPGGVENVRLSMIVYKNKVIAGDVSSTELGGFMHGFDIATSATWLSVPDRTAPVQGETLNNEQAVSGDAGTESGSEVNAPIAQEPVEPAADPVWDDSEEAAQYRE